MKKQMSPPRPKAAPVIPVRHQLEHEIPTVIHHPEENMTALGRLTFHILQDPRKYSTWALTVLLGILAVIVGINFSAGGRSRDADAWTKLETATKAEQRVEVAKEFPKSPASTWALLQAATEFHNLALADLPNNKDVALPLFKKALGLFDQVAKEAPADSFQARAAVWGKARTLEAQSDLGKAIEQYDLVITRWPDSPEAADAKRIVEALKQPDAANFYKELYSYSPTKVTLPPLSSEELNLPSTGVNPPDSKSIVPAQPKPVVTLPLELPPPTAAEKKKLEEMKPQSPAPKGEPSANASTTPAKKAETPLEVLKPVTPAPAATPKEKSPN
jgi:tetratricopeptide (TPR) repeat protein